MPTTYRVQVYEANIQRMFLPMGSGYRWMDKVRLQMHRAAVSSAPSRSGALAAAHRSSILPGSNQYQVRMEITNVSDHAEFVHEGTNRRPPGKLYAFGPGGPGRNTVSPHAGQHFGKFYGTRGLAGQRPNQWLDKACTRIAVQHGGIVFG
jgi:hypothetical protein